MALLTAIREHAQFAARFEVAAQNIDRPIAETPWLAEHRYGDGEYDARWYAVMSAKDHFTEGVDGAINDQLDAYRDAILASREVEADARLAELVEAFKKRLVKHATKPVPTDEEK